MTKIDIKLENCYGIKKLEYEFQFTEEQKAYCIYASNGTMKTSFANTFYDVQMKQASKDRLYGLPSLRQIKIDDIDIHESNVYVIHSYRDIHSTKISLLLANKDVKDRYDKACEKIENDKKNLFKLISYKNTEKKLIGLYEDKNIYEILEENYNDIIDISEQNVYCNYNYEKLFNDDTFKLLNDSSFQDNIKEYSNLFNDLISKSKIIRKSFNHHYANKVEKSLKDNKFFDAEHSIILYGKENKISCSQDLANELKTEMDRVLYNADLQKIFVTVEKKLSKDSLREFRDYIIENKEILNYLSEYQELQKNILLSYIAKEFNYYKVFIDNYKEAKESIKKCIEEANNKTSIWEKVIKIYNSRFIPPFNINIKNKSDSILKQYAPKIEFSFQENENEKVIYSQENLLELDILSQGEKRALYILNIIFDIEALKIINNETNQKIIFIIDDIADSFDYKNKYAIIEYLHEISKHPNFYCIFLTHNFDFYRNISSRLNLSRDYRLFSKKINHSKEIKLKIETYQNNAFVHWRNNLNKNEKYLISFIPFIRNMLDYLGHTNYFKELTSILHYKEDTKTFDIKKLKEIYQKSFNKELNIKLDDSTKIIDLIFELADTIAKDNDEYPELEGKIIISIAIRIKSEMFMYEMISDKEFINNLQKNQTYELIKKFNELYNEEIYTLHKSILNRVNIITPENIHINSFMYEPLLDTCSSSLKELYKDVKNNLIVIN